MLRISSSPRRWRKTYKCEALPSIYRFFFNAEVTMISLTLSGTRKWSFFSYTLITINDWKYWSVTIFSNGRCILLHRHPLQNGQRRLGVGEYIYEYMGKGLNLRLACMTFCLKIELQNNFSWMYHCKLKQLGNIHQNFCRNILIGLENIARFLLVCLTVQWVIWPQKCAEKSTLLKASVQNQEFL